MTVKITAFTNKRSKIAHIANYQSKRFYCGKDIRSTYIISEETLIKYLKRPKTCARCKKVYQTQNLYDLLGSNAQF